MTLTRSLTVLCLAGLLPATDAAQVPPRPL